jgi:protein TonB
MKRSERACLLLAAGISLGVHAAAAVWLAWIPPATDGLNKPPAQTVQLSLMTQRATPPPAVPEPVPATKPVPVMPPPRSRPVPQQPPRVKPDRTQPAPEPETVVSLPTEPAAAGKPETPMPQQPATTAAASARETYLARLLAHIDSHKFYPRSARRRGQEGDVKVMFYLQQDGGIRALEVSGDNRPLCAAAERAVRASLPLPQPPESVNLHEQVSFSMQFRLKG